MTFQPTFQSAAYSWLMIAAIAGSLYFWMRRHREDDRLVLIYVGALLAAFFGAKVVFLMAEGWLYFDAPDRWKIWLTGKTVLGALLGGYLGVEVMKKWIGYRKVTGDLFAQIVPASIIVGRLGCLIHGCCPGRICDAHWYTITGADGIPRWPAVPVEILFNVVAIILFAILRRGQKLQGQHFHLYMIGYGLFRFVHEYVRETPAIAFGMSGYQIASLALAGLGVWGFVRRSCTLRC